MMWCRCKGWDRIVPPEALQLQGWHLQIFRSAVVESTDKESPLCFLAKHFS